MTSTPTTSTTISASSYLYLAPASTPTHPSHTRDEIRQLVLEYLSSCCYADSAKAFVQEVDRREEEERQSQEAAGGGQADEGKRAVKSLKRKESAMGMQGIEATPPPFAAEPELDRDGMVVEQDDNEPEDQAEEREVERSLVKSVAFRLDRNGVEQPIEEDDEEQGWSMLSRDQLNEVRLRRDIRDAILSGRIQLAVDLITEHFPSVLAEPPAPSSTPTTSLKPSKPCLPTAFFVSTPPSPNFPDSAASFTNNGSTDSPGLPILGASFGSWSLSLEPQILALNLQLQTFVELMRVAHSPSSNASTPAGTSPLHPSSAGGSNGHSLGDSMLSNSTSSLSSNTTTSTHTMNIAISQSQALNAKVQRLPSGKDRESWERECIDVSGLLAYKDLSTCPVRGYLAQERREVLAELINAAILQRTNKTPMPLLSLAVRQTTALWSTLAEWKVQFPPPPPGGDKEKSKEGKEKSKGRTYPRFDVRTFLHEREVPESSSNNETTSRE